MEMKVYFLSDYGEYGAENVRATLDPEKLFSILAGCDYKPQTITTAKRKLRGYLRKSKTTPIEGHNLTDGWGGIMLHIIELE